MKKCFSNFTLIELLIVVAIIAILASILFPSFNKVRMQANSIACVNNLKQFGAAMSMYAGDFSDRLPINQDPAGWCGNYSFWYIPFAPYLNSTYEKLDKCKTFKCPSHQTPFGYTAFYPNWQPFASYGINQGLAFKSILSKWSKPSYCIVLMDAKDRNAGNDSFFVNGSTIDTCVAYTRHMGKANYLLGDFHVEAIKKIPQSSGSWMYGVDWNRWVPY